MRLLLLIFTFITSTFAASIQEDIWWRGETLLTFLDKNNITKEIYFNLSKTDKELCSEISAGVKYQVLYDEKGGFLQALIPISEQMQIHIFKDEKLKYALDIIPIEYHEVTQTITMPIIYSPYQDIISNTNNQALANEFIRAFKHSVNFKKIQKNDTLTIKYIQKIRDGRYFGTPNLLAAKIEVNKKIYYIFENTADQRYYDENARSLTSFFLKVPVHYSRISSKFTYKRWHPILKKYRAHFGIDYAAPIGRKIIAAANGKVIFKGKKGGYGNAVIIRHKDGYKSLYAHLSKFSEIKNGQWLKQGTVIGYVGSTGRSTGPHLHFGLYKNGKAINPEKILSITKTQLVGKAKTDFLHLVSDLKKEINDSIHHDKPLKLSDFKFLYNI